MKIRKATKKDVEKMKKVWKESDYFVVSNKKMRSAIEKSLKNSEIYLVEEMKRPIAYFVITSKNRNLYINFMAIAKDYQGIGIGKEVFKKILDIAKKRDSRKLQLAVYQKNFRAIGLYNKLGFYFTGFSKDPRDKNLGRKIKMEKALK